MAIDAVVETDLVSSLKVSKFPQLIFTKAGKILYREKGNSLIRETVPLLYISTNSRCFYGTAIRSADEFSKIMAYFYYGAGMPSCLSGIGDNQELIPSIPVNQ